MAVAGSEMPWFAVNVRSNQEKVVDALLQEKGFPTFCPTHRERSRRADKVLELDRPLFPGYLFCQFQQENRGPIVTLRPVVRVVGIGRTPVPVDPVEFRAIQSVVESGVAYRPWPYLNVGERVKLLRGPLAGLSGILTSDRGEDRVVVSVGLIQRSVAAEVSRSWLAPEQQREVSGARISLAKAAAATRSC